MHDTWYLVPSTLWITVRVRAWVCSCLLSFFLILSMYTKISGEEDVKLVGLYCCTVYGSLLTNETWHIYSRLMSSRTRVRISLRTFWFCRNTWYLVACSWAPIQTMSPPLPVGPYVLDRRLRLTGIGTYDRMYTYLRRLVDQYAPKIKPKLPPYSEGGRLTQDSPSGNNYYGNHI